MSLASDGLLARPSQPYAQEKLYYLKRYLSMVNVAMRTKWPTRAFVDLMSGPGRCTLPGGVEFEGSPILALRTEPAFTHIALAEASHELAEALRVRVGHEPTTAKVNVITGDCNDPETIEQIRAFVPPNALTIVFVDMLGLDVTMETLRALTTGRKMDLVITFQVQDLRRNVDDALVKPKEGDRLTRFFGSPEWRRHRPPSGDPIPKLTAFYEDRLQAIGYDYVGRSLDVMKNSKNAEQYRLLLASKDAKGREFFEKVAAISPTGARRLF